MSNWSVVVSQSGGSNWSSNWGVVVSHSGSSNSNGGGHSDGLLVDVGLGSDLDIIFMVDLKMRYIERELNKTND